MTAAPPFSQFQTFLREMFQFDHNKLDFGLFKVLRLKRTYIEQFISGDGDQDLRRIVSRQLQAIRSADDADERQWLAILLRKSSPLGTASGEHYNVQHVQRLEELHSLHLNWTPADERGKFLDEDGDTLPHPPDHRCYLERIFACAGMLPTR